MTVWLVEGYISEDKPTLWVRFLGAENEGFQYDKEAQLR
jgi:hypothetical protein